MKKNAKYDSSQKYFSSENESGILHANKTTIKNKKNEGGVPHHLFMNQDKNFITQISSLSQSMFLNPSHLGSP